MGAVDPEQASTFVIAITPFTVDGRFDEEAVRGHLRRMATAGIGVYVGGGGSGEGYVLSEAETRRLLEISVEELKGRVPVRAMGVEPRTSTHMIEFVELTSDLGLDAVQIYSLDQGHGHRPTPDEVYRYFDDVLRATSMSAVLSTHQSVGYKVPVAMLSEFVDHFEHVIGINCSHQDVGYLSAVIDAVGGRVDIHVGGPNLGLTALSLGANGYLSSEGNLAPRLCVGVIDAYRRDDARRLADWYGKLLRLSNALYGAGGIRATKAVLGALGLPGGSPRLPQLPLEPDRVPRLLALVETLGIAEIEDW
ncbi:MAG TPA: dihydrodipicolinate synthase family protein [Acidimicrobiales bacterium]